MRLTTDLEQAGGTPRYTEIPRAGHNIWNPIYSDWQTDFYGLYPWLFAQSLAVPEPWGSVLNLYIAVGLGAVWALMAQAGPTAEAFGRRAQPTRILGLALAMLTLAWAAVA